MKSLQTRAIIHLDLDAFYAQVEQVRLGLDASVPLCVQQWTAVIAVNYAARKFGIKRSHSAKECVDLCPDVVLVHVPTMKEGDVTPVHRQLSAKDKHTHKVSLQPYQDASLKIMKIIESHFPDFQKASVDEAYIDVTLKVAELMEEYDPDVEPIVDWSGRGNMIGGEVSVTKGWEDLQLALAADISAQIRAEIFDTLGYTSSTGIAHNKTLAKLISSENKPNKQSILRGEMVSEYMKGVQFSKIKGLGGNFGELVNQHFPVDKATELWKYDIDEMKSKLGNEDGQWVYDICRGICHDPVVKAKPPASYGAFKLFNWSVKTVPELHRWIGILSVECQIKLDNDFHEYKRWPKTLTVHYRQPNFSKTINFPHRDDFKDIQSLVLPILPTDVELQIRNISITLNSPVKISTNTISKWLKVEDSTVNEDSEYRCTECLKIIQKINQQEHQDYHLALELSRSSDKPAVDTKPKQTDKQKKNQKKDPVKKKTIAEFFKPKSSR
ncbi:DNA-directed DNA polymerase eta rad30 [Boothiomyces macroporosus]|uniref:DNA polymerase eta n=1 Tax=Boothiomyces macroporosus TaxID=261099 RepID=A0AAD5U8W2_9FUNG|nr:DNA-directed DNA polymerase eta rad30 [Boothiomyces macroporosus]